VDEYLACSAEVEDYVTQSRLSPALVFKVRLVLEELVMNLIEHGTGSPTRGSGSAPTAGLPSRYRALPQVAPPNALASG
jgi:hypothetical protein